MLQTANKNLIHKIIQVLVVGFVLLAASCNGSVTPTIDQVMPETTTDTSPAQIMGFPASVSKISAGQHLRFENISLEQGLSQSTVFSMLQDSQGFMWFGTEDGLNKYDGYTFTVYKHDPDNPNRLSNNSIQAMLEDSSGALWFGTSEGGLDRYDRKLNQFTHYRNDLEDPSSLSDNEITAIYQDQYGILWIGTSAGLYGFDQENERFIHYQHDPDDPNSLSYNAVAVIYEDQDGALWIGTDYGGLNRLVPSAGSGQALSEVEGFERENERWWHYVNDQGAIPWDRFDHNSHLVCMAKGLNLQSPA